MRQLLFECFISIAQLKLIIDGASRKKGHDWKEHKHIYTHTRTVATIVEWTICIYQVHYGPDDMGLGGNAGSLKGGNAGIKVACCIIARADPAHHQHHIHSDDKTETGKHGDHSQRNRKDKW